jgi:death on curing protein
MGRTGQILRYEEILLINQRMIEAFGGFYTSADHNLANPDSLHHVLEQARGSFFGQELYPSPIAKAALICWRIIKGHIFHDGNKRTGLETCRQILEMNGYTFIITEDVLDISLRIAQSNLDLQSFTDWLKQSINKESR